MRRCLQHKSLWAFLRLRILIIFDVAQGTPYLWDAMAALESVFARRVVPRAVKCVQIILHR
jgi:hypothetical protein